MGVKVGVQLKQNPTGDKQLYLRQEAWARSSARDHRVCLHPWSGSYPEGTESPEQKTIKSLEMFVDFILLFSRLQCEMFGSFLATAWNGFETINME